MGERVGGVVLCGGRSSRMGRPKAWLPFGDEVMLQRVVRVLRDAVGPVVVVAAPGQDVPPLPAEVRVVRDEVGGKGPLAGLAAGLAALAGEVDAVYLSACDAPLLTPAFVRRVVELLEEPNPPGPPSVLRSALSAELPAGRPRGKGGEEPPVSFSPFPRREGGRGVRFFLAAVPRVGDRLHPLAAAYRVSILPHVREMLAADRLRMLDLFDRVPTRVLGPDDLADADPHLDSLRNVNTPDEYEAALHLQFPPDARPPDS